MKKNNIPIPEPVFPEYFYKYLRVERAIEIITNKYIWFSSPKYFNDPFDFYVDLVDFDIEKEAIKGFINDKVFYNRQVRREEMQKNKRNSFRIRNQFREQFEEFFYNSGVCCFSETCENLLMWSHYSQNHTGVCLKFKQSIKDIGLMTSTINYVQEFEKKKFFNVNGEAVYHVCFTKSKEWSYEKEIRIVDIFDSGKKFFPIEDLEEIILGCRIKKEDIEKIKKCIEPFKHIKLTKSILSKKSFSLEFENIRR